MKKILFACISLFLIAFSCKKSDSPAAVTAYMSITTGSSWHYDVISNPGQPGSTTVADTVTVTANDTTVEQGTANARKYRIFKHTNGNTSDYYNITGNDYYRFQSIPLASVQIQNLYLKDNVAVGNAWSQTLTVPVSGLGNVPVTVTNSISAKGTSKTVNGITYNDVITVTTTLNSASLPGAIVSDIKSYYAPSVGLIQGDYKVVIALASVDINTQTLLKKSIIL